MRLEIRTKAEFDNAVAKGLFAIATSATLKFTPSAKINADGAFAKGTGGQFPCLSDNPHFTAMWTALKFSRHQKRSKFKTRMPVAGRVPTREVA